MGEDAVDEVGAETARRRKHAALQHQLSDAHASQKRRLASLIGAGDHDQLFAVGRHIVADDFCLHAQREAHVVEILAGKTHLSARIRQRETEMLFQRVQLLAQIDAADVEGELGPQHAEETQHVLGALSERIRSKSDAAVPEFRHRSGPRLVSRREVEVVAGRRPAEHLHEPIPQTRQPAHEARQPVSWLAGLLADHVVFAFEAGPQLGAHQDPAAEPQASKMLIDDGEVVVAELPAQHGEQRRKRVRFEFLVVPVGDRPHPLQQLDKELHHRHRSLQQGARIIPPQTVMDLLFLFQCFQDQGVELPKHLWVVQAIPQSRLTVFDGFHILVGPGKDGLADDFQNEFVVPRHCPEKRIKLEVLYEGRFIRRRRPLQVEIARPVHEMGFHDARRLRNCPYVRRYFSAIESA